MEFGCDAVRAISQRYRDAGYWTAICGSHPVIDNLSASNLTHSSSISYGRKRWHRLGLYQVLMLILYVLLICLSTQHHARSLAAYFHPLGSHSLLIIPTPSFEFHVPLGFVPLCCAFFYPKRRVKCQVIKSSIIAAHAQVCIYETGSTTFSRAEVSPCSRCFRSIS